MGHPYYALSGVFSIATIPQDLRPQLAYDIYNAAAQVQAGVPLEKVTAGVTFNELGHMQSKYEKHWSRLEAPEREPTNREFPISSLYDVLHVPLELLPRCLVELTSLSDSDLIWLLPDEGEKAEVIWKDGPQPDDPDDPPRFI